MLTAVLEAKSTRTRRLMKMVFLLMRKTLRGSKLFQSLIIAAVDSSTYHLMLVLSADSHFGVVVRITDDPDIV